MAASTNPVAGAGNKFIEDLMKTTAEKKTATGAVQDRFLKLLITQMQNQDPLNPMDNAQLTSQIAQISTVSGIDKLNTTIGDMSNAFSASQSLQASALIGHGVLAKGATLELDQGLAVGGVTLTEPADNISVSIMNKNKETIRTLEMPAHNAGIAQFAWDGKTDAGTDAADGKYTFAATAVRSGQKIDSTTTLGFARVQSVTLGTDGMQLNTSSLGALGMSDVKQIL
jgi:flagellar basal-body rod modification protein FlgD